MTLSERTDHQGSVESIVERGLVSIAFQPIVRLRDGAVLGHEALARGPRGTALEAPEVLFGAARSAGLTAELDELCLRAAFLAAEHRGLRTLFVNVEPETFTGPALPSPEHMQIVVEVTERGVTEQPAELLNALERARDVGWAVAIDDIGADWRSLAMLSVLAPEVVKLDRDILADGPTRESGRVLRACRAHVDRRSGVLLAEGIEHSEHVQHAIGYGAALGQGYLFGRPQSEPLTAQADQLQFPVGTRRLERELTPFALLKREGIATAVTTKRHLLEMSRDIELDAVGQEDPNILLATFETTEKFSSRTRERYADIARGLAYVAVFGHGMKPAPLPGVVGTGLAEREPLSEEWDVLAVGPHQSSGLIARDLGDEAVSDLDRHYEYALLSDRSIIESAARSLMLRITKSAHRLSDPA